MLVFFRFHLMRLIFDPPASGAWNMAIDEVLAQSAAAHGVTTLRFYSWDPPTLSLGYFQQAAERNEHTPVGRAIGCDARAEVARFFTIVS